jgi:hypothetical protein
MRADLLAQLVDVIGMNTPEPLVRSAVELLLLVAQHLFPSRRVVDLIGRHMPVPEPVVGTLDGQGVPLLALPNGHLEVFANQGIAQRAGEGLRVETALYQAVLSSGSQHYTRGLRIFVAGEDDNGRFRGLCTHPSEPLQTTTVGKSEIEQDDVDLLAAKLIQASGEAIDPLDGEGLRRGCLETSLHQPGMPRAAFEQENVDRSQCHASGRVANCERH